MTVNLFYDYIQYLLLQPLDAVIDHFIIILSTETLIYYG